MVIKHLTAFVFFLLFALPAFSQITLFVQSGNVDDNWSYNDTGSDPIASAEALSPLNYTSAPQSLVVGGNTPGGSCIDGGTGNGPSTQRAFFFDEVDISTSNQFERNLVFNFGNRLPVCTGTGWDNGENLIFIPIHDGIAQTEITLAVGGNDAIFPIADNQYNYSIPPCVNNFAFELSIFTNRRDELLFLDDVILSAPDFNGPSDTTFVSLAICEGQLPYLWNGLLINNAGIQNITLPASNGCDSIVQLELTINPGPVSNLTFNICSGEFPIVINGISYEAAGNYLQNFPLDSGCDSILNITIVEFPDFNSIENLTICSNDLPYNWQGIQITEAGTYNAEYQSQQGCDSTFTIVIEVILSPTIDISLSSSTVNIDNPVIEVTNNSSNFDEFIWSSQPTGTFDIEQLLSPTIELPNETGSYTIVFSAFNEACAASENFVVTVVEPEFTWEFELPNVFTPNGDNVNDFLELDYKNYNLAQVVISNRWGQIVFDTDDNTLFWDGLDQFTNNPCPEGVYFVKVDLNYFNESKTFHGFVHLIR